MSRFYFIAVLVVLGIFTLGTVFAAARIEYYVDYPSALIVLVPPIVLCFAAFPPRVIGRSFRVAFDGVTATEGELKSAAALFRTFERSILLSGLIGALIGVIVMLSQLASISNVSGGFALLLVSVFYALIVTLALPVPFRAAVEHKLSQLAESGRR